MPKIGLVVFDFDGTLVDTQKGIRSSIYYSLKQEKVENNKLVCDITIGPPLDEILLELCPSATKNIIKKLSTNFKEHYDKYGCLEYKIYPSIPSLLRNLSQKYLLLIATNKRENPTKRILFDSGLSNFFKDIFCIDSYPKHYSDKSGMLRYIAKLYGMNSNYYIGDTINDFYAAEKAEYKFIAVNWGYDPKICQCDDIELKSNHPYEIERILEK